MQGYPEYPLLWMKWIHEGLVFILTYVLLQQAYGWQWWQNALVAVGVVLSVGYALPLLLSGFLWLFTRLVTLLMNRNHTGELASASLVGLVLLPWLAIGIETALLAKAWYGWQRLIGFSVGLISSFVVGVAGAMVVQWLIILIYERKTRLPDR